jgi:hypothetical protein
MKLSKRMNLDCIEVEPFYLEPDGSTAPYEVARARVEAALQSPSWIVSASNRIVGDVILPRAEAVIWLDYSFWVRFSRLLKRIFYRLTKSKRSSNKVRNESNTQRKFRLRFSHVRWFFKIYTRSPKMPNGLNLPENSHLLIFHFKSPREAESWLARLPDHA